MTHIALHAAHIYTGSLNPSHLSNGYLSIDDGTITAVGAAPHPDATVVECDDVDLIPGLVDLHSDCWDQRTRPRPSFAFPLDESLIVLDTEAAAWGITTHFACIAIQDDITKWRTLDDALAAADTMTTLRPHLRVDHRIHLRIDLTTEHLDAISDLARREAVSLMSYLDHTPGQGQFANEAEWRASMAHAGARNLDQALAKRRERQPHVAAVREDIAALAHQHDITLASHDDTNRDEVERAHKLGARIVEFPVTREAANTARSLGLFTVMGAPNLLRGSSQTAGNLSAREAFEADLLTIVASDYYPATLLRSIYRLADQHIADLTETIPLATANPARAARLDDRGTLQVGKRADIVAVRRIHGHPAVSQTWIEGRPVFQGFARAT